MMTHTSFVHTAIQKSAKQTIVGGIVATIIVALCIAGSWGYWQSLLHQSASSGVDASTALFFLVPVGLVGIVMIVLGARRLSDPQSHPLYKELKAYGEPAELVRRIDHEVAGRADICTIASQGGASFTLTKSWFLASPSTRFVALPLDEIVWAHKHVLRNHIVMKVVSIVVHPKTGKSLTFKTGVMSEKACDQVLFELGRRRPWLMLGYDGKLARAWRKDRAGVVSMVEARRQAVLASSAKKQA